MRIISGRYKGQIYKSPRTHRTHPMGDKIKTAIFNMLGDMAGMSVLDAFAGSGALAFEAISRGAEKALLIEIDKKAFNTIKDNIEALGLEGKVEAKMRNVKGWSKNNQDRQFDLVFCDPPYDAVLETVIQQISVHVREGGLLVLSWPESEPEPELEDMTIQRNKTYGNAKIVIYSKTKSS